MKKMLNYLWQNCRSLDLKQFCRRHLSCSSWIDWIRPILLRVALKKQFFCSIIFISNFSVKFSSDNFYNFKRRNFWLLNFEDIFYGWRVINVLIFEIRFFKSWYLWMGQMKTISSGFIWKSNSCTLSYEKIGDILFLEI